MYLPPAVGCALHGNDQRDRGDVTAVAFATDGVTVATGYRGGTIWLREVAMGSELRRLAGPEDGAWSLAFASDGKGLTTAGLGKPRPAPIVATGPELARLEGHLGDVLALAFSPDSGRLATGGGDTTVVTWDIAPFRG